MSYGLRDRNGRLHGLGMLNGLGDFNPPARPTWIDPGYPPDPNIVAQNTLNNDAYQVAMAGAQAQNNLDQCRANAENANSPEQKAQVLASCGQAYSDAGAYAAQTAVTPVSWYGGGGTAVPFTGVSVLPETTTQPPVLRGGQLTFTTSKGTAALQVGDTWVVAIIGASPNSPVTVSGSGPGGAFSNTPMGSTDGSGNFSKSGSVGTTEIGSWSEQWAVGGAPSGSLSFTVAAVPTSPVIFKSGTTDGSTTGGAAAGGGTTIAAFDFSKIPWWGWAAAAGAALFMFGGQRGR